MYKLIHFRSTNIIGFMSGMGKKVFDLDLEDHQDKDLMIIVGDNASGKSTFLSLVHPWHTPTDGRTKFVVEGKEGTLIRTYKNDDGTIIVSKCVYKPKSDGGHIPKCFLAITRPGQEEVELNANGNVSSYYDLIYTYFGINKEYINFASYNDAIGSIVRMNDTERKNSVGAMVPNTARFEVAYATINDRYRDLRNMIRNIAQKILALRDEESLRADLKRITKELTRAREERDEYMQKFARSEGRVKELAKGRDIRQMNEEYNRRIMEMATIDSELSMVRAKLLRSYEALDIITDGPDTINFSGIDGVHSQVLKYERKLQRSQMEKLGASERVAQLARDYSDQEKAIAEAEAVLYSIQTQDVDELRATRARYERQLSELRYTSMKDRYASMSYDEVVQFSKNVAMIDTMIQALFDEYGDLVTRFFKNPDAWMGSHDEATYQGNMAKLSVTIETKTARKDLIYRQLIEKEQYRRLQDTLAKRPKSCTIDSCPFIVDALKWQTIAGEITRLKQELDGLNAELQDHERTAKIFDQEMAFRVDVQRLVDYIKGNMLIMLKYLNLTPDQLYQAIAQGTWNKVLDQLKLKSIASVLSEKDLYIRITTQLIPELDRSIEVAQVYGTNRDMIRSQIERSRHTMDLLTAERERQEMSVKASDRMIKSHEKKLRHWRAIEENLDLYRKAANERIEAAEDIDSIAAEIRTINEILTRCTEYDAKIRESEQIIQELEPAEQQITLDLKTLTQLKLEKSQVELDFTIVDMIRSLIQPGKGIRKELINIYMYDIYQTANQLLLNTFDGNLYLKEFIITDKEFVIPYVYNGSEGSDVSYASSAQQSLISTAISLAILSKMVDRYGIIASDELDAPLSPSHKEIFIEVLVKQIRFIGINQMFMITHSPEYYIPYAENITFLKFPGGKVKGEGLDIIDVTD